MKKINLFSKMQFRSLFVCGLIAIASAAFVSCGGGDDDGPKVPDTEYDDNGGDKDDDPTTGPKDPNGPQGDYGYLDMLRLVVKNNTSLYGGKFVAKDTKTGIIGTWMPIDGCHDSEFYGYRFSNTDPMTQYLDENTGNVVSGGASWTVSGRHLTIKPRYGSDEYDVYWTAKGHMVLVMSDGHWAIFQKRI